MPRVLAVGAHPDDIEILMAGTLLRLRDEGWEVHYLNLCHGGLGTESRSREEAGRTRREEARNACALIGAVHHESLTEDLSVFYTADLVARVAAIVREAEPEAILTHYPFDYMEDHSNTARVAVTAAFARGMRNFETDPARPPTRQPVALYHAMPYGLRDPLGRFVTPDFHVDIGGVMDRKTRMLACHRSQKEWLDVSQGQDSYLDAMRDMMRELGRHSGRCEYAEGWIRHLHLGLCGPAHHPLGKWAL